MKKLIFVVIIAIFTIACIRSNQNSYVEPNRDSAIVFDSTDYYPERPVPDSVQNR